MGDNSRLVECWSVWSHRVEHFLDNLLPIAESEPSRLNEAMRYSVLGAGKRFRAALVYATGEGLTASKVNLDLSASAVELIHAFSLVHDDLPAMDNDDLRRGKPSCHIVFGEAIAILTGDALQSLAFNLLARQCDSYSARTQLKMIRILAEASGTYGMAGGQAIDLSNINTILSKTELEAMHRMKTGLLITASIQLGALSSGTEDQGLLKSLDQYGLALGLAFQIMDDILDATEDDIVLGKTKDSDSRNNKSTFLTVLGEDRSRQAAKEYVQNAKDSLSNLNMDTSKLSALADFVISRHH